MEKLSLEDTRDPEKLRKWAARQARSPRPPRRRYVATWPVGFGGALWAARRLRRR